MSQRPAWRRLGATRVRPPAPRFSLDLQLPRSAREPGAEFELPHLEVRRFESIPLLEGHGLRSHQLPVGLHQRDRLQNFGLLDVLLDGFKKLRIVRVLLRASEHET